MKPKTALIALQVGLVCLVVVATAIFLEELEAGFEKWPTLIGIRPLAVFSVVLAGVMISLILVALVFVLQELLLAKGPVPRIVLSVLRFLRVLFVVSAFYSVIAFSVFWIQTGLMHPTLFVTEVLLCVISVAAAAFLTPCIRNVRNDHYRINENQTLGKSG
jgi:hypothetical protein